MPEAISEAVHTIPGGALAGLIDRYDGFEQRGVAPARHLGLPSPYMTLIVMLDEPMQMARLSDGTHGPVSFHTLVGGLHVRPVEIVHDGIQSGIQLSIDPLASRALFGMPAGELAERDLHGEEVLGATAHELFDRVGGSHSWRERFTVLDETLAPRAAAPRPQNRAAAHPPAPLVAAWGLLRASGGTLPVTTLAREVGWSARQLEKTFRREIGMAPKQAARVIRFDRARRMVQVQARDTAARTGAGTAPSPHGLDLARVAADCGYHDQPHLIRDFRAFSGMAPTAWLAHEFANVQVEVTAAP